VTTAITILNNYHTNAVIALLDLADNAVGNLGRVADARRRDAATWHQIVATANTVR
jgi:hypothetical protein